MLTLVVALFAVILLAHFFADVIKAAAVVACVLGALYLVRDVSFTALADDGARALYDATSAHNARPSHHAIGRRI